MRTIVLYFVLVLNTYKLYGQTSNTLDSLQHVLLSAKNDTNKIKLLLNIQKLYTGKNYDSFYYYLTKADELAKNLKTDYMAFNINAGYAEYFYYKNDYKQSIAYATESKDIAEKRKDLKLLAKSYNNLSAIYNHFGRHKNAIDCILKCLEISEQSKDSASFPIRNLTASNTYFNLQQYDKAIEYAGKAISFGWRFNNLFAVLMGLNNQSASYSALNQLDSSISISKRQLALAKELEDIVNINYALINLCLDNYRAGNNNALAIYAGELSEYAKKFPDEKLVSEIYNAIASHYIASEKFDLARSLLDSGIAIAKRDENTDALGNLYRMYTVLSNRQGNTKEAEKYAYKYDSILRAANVKELNFYAEDLETKYETQKKESQIKLQQSQIKQKNTLNYLLIASATATLIILLLTYRNHRNRQKLQQAKIEELETEKQLTATEAVLKGEEQERSRLAKDLHDGLGGMLSGIKHSLSSMKENLIMTPDNARAFERSIDMLNSSISEMRRVAHNLMPEMLVKYGLDIALREFCSEITGSGITKVNYQSIGMDNAVIEQTAAVAIYRSTQELVNNAIKHGNANEVLVQLHLYKQEKILALTVEDDGKGMNVEVLKQSNGIGWKNIQNRVDFLQGKLDVQSEPGNGTSVMIEIKI